MGSEPRRAGRARTTGDFARRWLLKPALWCAALAIGLSAGYTLFAMAWLPPLQRWHTERLEAEFTAARHAGIGFDEYLVLETALFDEMRQRVAAWPAADPDFIDSRFNPDGAAMRLSGGAPFNRSVRLAQATPRGQALLVHGLTDSPYLMLALARSLHGHGFDVTVLRLPGHGTLPSMLTTMDADDWHAALRIAARAVAARAIDGQPFYIGGYSTGGTLALTYALDALHDPALRRPDRVLLAAPAIELPAVAALSAFIDLIGQVPWAPLQKARWQEVVAEYDPYKFNSFPVNATRQVRSATKRLQHALELAEAEGRLARLPPLLAWQSLADSTVGAAGVAEQLFARLPGAQHRLVLFDVNRDAGVRGLLSAEPKALLARVLAAPRRYTLDLAGGELTSDGKLRVTRIAPDGTRTVRDTGLAWPPRLVSLGHLALTVPADDPVYGIAPGSGHAGLPSLGSLLLQGESGALTLQLGALTRVRSNPFWPLIEADVAAVLEVDRAAPGR